MTTVASHGDFANRKLQLDNTEILRNLDFRREASIAFEAYDETLAGPLGARHCDRPFPTWWHPADPVVSFRQGSPVVGLLLHPRSGRQAANRTPSHTRHKSSWTFA